MRNKVNIDSLIFDLDDTVLMTNDVFNKINNETTAVAYKILNHPSLTPELVLKTFNGIDLENAKKHGLSPDRYILSWEETMHYFSNLHNIPLDQEDIEKVKKEASNILTVVIDPYPNAINVLKEIRKLGYEMNILTAGVEHLQMKRIMDVNIKELFDNIYIVPKKDPEIIKNTLKGRVLSKSVMIGNSLSSDIHPALSNDMYAIHIERETWAYDHYAIDTKHPKYYAVKQLDDVPVVIKKIMSRI